MNNANKQPSLSYSLLNMIAAFGFCIFGLFFYISEFARGSFEIKTIHIIAVLLGFFAMFVPLLIINLRKCKNGFGVLMNVSLPLAVFNIAVLVKRAGSVGFLCVGIAFAAILIIYFLISVIIKPHTNDFSKIVILLLYGKGEKCETSDENNVPPKKFTYNYVVAFLITLFIISTIAMTELGIFQTNYNAYFKTDAVYRETYVLREDMGEYVKLECKYWNNMDEYERLELLQKIAERESERLGLPETPTVTAAELYNKFYDVNYNADANLIELDLNMVARDKNGYKALKALSNGTYLAYENAKKLLLEAINTSDEMSDYSELTVFRDTKLNSRFVFEENAARYSVFIQSEYKRKNMLYRFDGNNERY